jgi:hypothetical protein
MLEQAEVYKKTTKNVQNLVQIEKLNSFIVRLETTETELQKKTEKLIEKIQEKAFISFLNNDLDKTKNLPMLNKDLMIDFQIIYLKVMIREKFKQYQKFSTSSNFI